MRAPTLEDPHTLITADPDFMDLAWGELKAVTVVPELEQVAPDVNWLYDERSFWEIAQQWYENPPIIVRHICPVQVIVPLTATTSDLGKIANALEEIILLVDPDQSFSVQARILGDLPYKPFDLNKALSQQIQEETFAVLDIRAPQQILSVVCTYVPTARVNEILATNLPANLPASPSAVYPVAFLGISPSLLNLSDWAGGMRRFAREKGQISRAEFKLLEAIEVFGIDLPPRGTALDLGASPGGWTRVLRQHEQYVTSVDPGELAPALAQDSRVRHKRMTAEAYLDADPDEFNLIVNDMRMDARDSARLMNGYANQLYRDGLAVMTLKLPEQKRKNVIDHACKILRERYEIVGARQLFHNRSEITVCLRCK